VPRTRYSGGAVIHRYNEANNFMLSRVILDSMKYKGNEHLMSISGFWFDTASDKGISTLTMENES
jgi:hypothetical protein